MQGPRQVAKQVDHDKVPKAVKDLNKDTVPKAVKVVDKDNVPNAVKEVDKDKVQAKAVNKVSHSITYYSSTCVMYDLLQFHFPIMNLDYIL